MACFQIDYTLHIKIQVSQLKWNMSFTKLTKNTFASLDEKLIVNILKLNDLPFG